MTTAPTQEQKLLEKKRKRNKKVLKLSVYKNTLLKEEQEFQTKLFTDYFNSVLDVIPSPTSFAIVAWDNDYKSVAFIVNPTDDADLFPEKVKIMLTRELDKLDGDNS